MAKRKFWDPEDFPHDINPVLEQFGVKTFRDLTKTRDPKKLAKIISEYWDDNEICRCVAKNFNADADTVEVLSKHPCEEVREAVAERRNLDIKIAVRLVFDISPKVKVTLSRVTPYDMVKKYLIKLNYNNPKIVDYILMKDDEEMIMDFISSQDLRIVKAFLKSKFFKEKYLKACLEEQIKNPELHLITLVLKNPNYTEDLLNFILSNFAMEPISDEEIYAIELKVK